MSATLNPFICPEAGMESWGFVGGAQKRREEKEY